MFFIKKNNNNNNNKTYRSKSFKIDSVVFTKLSPGDSSFIELPTKARFTPS
jgi:hypothetical protein